MQLRHGELVLPRRTDFHRFPKQESFFLMVFPILHYDYGDIMAQWDMMEYNGYHYGHSVDHGVHWSYDVVLAANFQDSTLRAS